LASGIEALKNDYFSAVLLDLTLPDSKGFETLEQLIKASPDVNVIVMTGLAAKEIGIRAVKVGAQDFLVKGEFDSDQLAKTLRYSIERNSVLQRLEETQRIAHIGNWEFLVSTEIFKLSSEVYRMFGYLTKDIVFHKRLLVQHVHKDDLEIIDDIVRSAFKGKLVTRDFRVIDKNNEVRYLNIQSSPSQPNAEGRYSNVKGIVQDITERKLAELELLQSQKQYKTIFSQSKDAIYISDGRRIVDFNDATLKLFGYSETELKNLHVEKLYLNPDDRNHFLKIINEVHSVKNYETELVTKNGSVRQCLLTTNFISNDDFTGYHGIIRDITERKQTEELRKAKELAERSAKMKEQFLANVSHEMRTPMNAILGLTNLLLKTEVDGEQDNYLTSIRESSQHLLGIINDILEISSLREGKINLEEKELNIQDLIHNLTTIIGYKIKEKNLELEINIEENVPKCVLGDVLRVQQVLTNLAGNAVKFTEKGFVRITVEKTRETETEDFLEFRVTDSGIGIPEDKIEMIFETFTRVFDEKVKTYGGTGLGLAITKQLVQLHGGTVRVESVIDEGSTFICEIPFKKFQLSTETDKEPEVEEIIDLNIGRDIHILLAEDHKLNQIVARKTLEKEFDNVKVTIADNGKIAVDKLAENEFDLILMDIQMPVMDGYEATKYIREQMPPNKANTVIFAMTAHAHMAQDEKYKEYGMDDCVLKPFDPKQLFSKIAYYIHRNNNQKDSDNNTENNMSNSNGMDIKIDLGYMDLMADGDNDMKKVMLELLFDEPVEEIKSMYGMNKNEDWDALKKVSHKMKSTLAFVGNDTITNINQEIEQIAMDVSTTEKLPVLIRQLDEMYQVVLVQLKEQHGKLN
jgi:PAS domain S-box-containing protein